MGLQRDRGQKRIAEGRIIFGKTGKAGPIQKKFLSERGELRSAVDSWWDDVEKNSDGQALLTELMDAPKLVDHPKPVGLLVKMIESFTKPDEDAIVLDFFAGSATTAHAVMKVNALDGGSRRFIQVQLPEPTSEKSEGRKAGYTTIAEISRERINRAAERINSESIKSAPDMGFRAYKLTDTNFIKWRTESDINVTALEQHLLDLRESSDDDATADDLLTEILIKQGHSLVEQIRDVSIADLPYKSVVRLDEVNGDEDTLVLAYLDEHTKPSLTQLRAAIETKPIQFIILEDAFQGDDELKTNLAQMCKTNNIELWTA